MNWTPLNAISQLDEIDRISQESPVVIFKHSTRCSVSATVWDRMNRSAAPEAGPAATWFYLDLIAHRDVSNAIAQRYDVQHESPQLLVIRNGKTAWHESHFGITRQAVEQAVAAA